MLTILAWILTGLVIGLIARLIVPGRQSIGMLMTILVGIIGAFVGGLLSTAIWGTPIDAEGAEVSQLWAGWLMSIVGAVIVLIAYVKLIGTDLSVRRSY